MEFGIILDQTLVRAGPCLPACLNRPCWTDYVGYAMNGSWMDGWMRGFRVLFSLDRSLPLSPSPSPSLSLPLSSSTLFTSIPSSHPFPLPSSHSHPLHQMRCQQDAFKYIHTQLDSSDQISSDQFSSINQFYQSNQSSQLNQFNSIQSD